MNGYPTAEETAWMKRIAEAERDNERTTVVLGPFTAWLLIGMIQLAARHPHFAESPNLVVTARGFVDQLTPLFAGTPGEPIIARGWDPASDVERDPS